jgi:hypothetical protein
LDTTIFLSRIFLLAKHKQENARQKNSGRQVGELLLKFSTSSDERRVAESKRGWVALPEITTMNLKSAESAISGAWQAGLVIGMLTLIGTGAAIVFSSAESRGAVVVPLANVAILFALSYGVWRKNRICAVLLAGYFVFLIAVMTVSWVQSKTVPLGILLYFVAMALCLNGARGTFAYHKIKQSEAGSSQEYAEQQ